MITHQSDMSSTIKIVVIAWCNMPRNPGDPAEMDNKHAHIYWRRRIKGKLKDRIKDMIRMVKK